MTLVCQGMSPSLVMQTLDLAFAHCFPELFATAFLASFEPDACTYVSAGHPDALLLGVFDHRHLPATGPLLGLFAQANHAQRDALIRPDEVLVVATDGLIEAQHADGRRLWHHGLAEIVRACRAGDPSTLARRAVDEIAARYDVRDDHALATFQYG
jgi:serine phosphatase RsbU (regulator of sigma subunit)